MSNRPNPIPVWGGIECTINRVGDSYFDQLARSGHRQRTSHDIDRIAELGIQTLRAAICWEHYDATRSWKFADNSLAAMNRLGIRPILGLVHHGSGPPCTDLLDPQFPKRLAAFALQVAQRFPWVTDYTPVNEPQTTGRFACLYAHWYPHHREMRSYLQALVNQMKGIVLAMQAIRSVQPAARLVHTEDGGITFCSPGLESFRWEREQRRWLGMDLLCGCVTPHHPLFEFLLIHGLAEREIHWFSENPCPPSILGLNYYVTSDRYLDDRVHLYPDFFRGGDTRYEPLVDIEAVRVAPDGIAGARAILTEAYARYGIPVAITEAHLGGESWEQIRWLAEIWREANEARCAGVDVAAVTVWGLFGLYDWCNLCTRDAGIYEPGVFDVSCGTPRETPLAEVVRQIAAGETLQHRALSTTGWWRRGTRINVIDPHA